MKEKELNFADERMNGFLNELLEQRDKMTAQANKTMASAIACVLFAPDTEDRKEQEKRLKNSRYCLLCEIGKYDSMRNSFIDKIKFYKEWCEIRRIPPTSHEILENYLMMGELENNLKGL